MSEVHAASGAGAQNNIGKTQQKPSQTKAKGTGTEIADEMKNAKNPKGTKVPQKPVPKVIIITIGRGSSLGYLAEKHHTTVKEIMALNPEIQSADKIKEGQQIKINHIDDKELKEYEDYQSKIRAEQYEKERTQALAERKELAKKQIDKATKQGWNTDYKFSINEQGYIIIKPLERKKLYEIRSDLGLPPGHLDDMNNLESKYGEIPSVSDGVRDVQTWDNVKTRDGDTFIISPGAMRTERTWTQAFKDLWNSINPF